MAGFEWQEDAVVAALPRRQFLQAGGGLVLGVVLPASAAQERDKKPPEAAVGQASAKVTSTASGFAPNAFVRIDRSGLVTLVMHKVEMGQGTFTSMPMLLAEELEIELDQVRLEQAPPDGQRYADPLLGGQVTGGSTSVRGAWLPLRQAGAAAREMLVSAAAARWGVRPASCHASKGGVTHVPSGRRLGYGELADEAGRLPVPKEPALKDAKDFRLIGTPVKRLDSPDKINGRAQYGIDVRLPGMLVASVAACPVVGGTLREVDPGKALAIRGVRRVLRIDNAVAVLADHTGAARQGLAALAPQWNEGPHAGFSSVALVAEMEAASKRPGAVARQDGDTARALDGAARKIEAVYQMPFLAHATMEPINCTVHLRPEGCDIWVGTQVPTFTQAAAAQLTGLPLDKVQVHNHYIGGGFGRRLEVDFVVQAVAFAKQVDRPVKFIWSREEDIQHDMFRPYYYDRLSAALDAGGRPLAWTHRITASSIMARFAPETVKDGVDTDAVEGARDMPYAIPNVMVDYVRHEPPVPTAFWRGVGPTHNIFVVESFIDELAVAAGQDPCEYRRTLLARAPRMKAVLELAARKAGWGSPLKLPAGRRGGRGIAVQHAFGTYMAQVAEVAVDPEGQVSVLRVVCALDCGQVVNPDTVAAQIESGVVFGLTAALWNEVNFEKGRVLQSNFHDYRMMRINEAPRVEVHILPSRDKPGGIGEPGTSAAAPALANAVFAATGRRVRRLPIASQDLKAG
ncbi:xanthine dehydrogenase family protein molybdopterin-binding subunit [Aquabacterium sp. A7-Y]|uniref:xanthine dehydrogenase family protein molybdopterin-binding subunit n=1 Tax=Aquabacterium sp. A7-Y TaxID=1349605 RepID=UPI00223E69DA|nr:xanthine dehydrogenase family protein molybdopterin-binding subunit [Aquabacterium sp. A7-Y]MCW7539419.1 xanthine dehydrogenase family protein molybdopterin-binding subunit [Aquabacterium sp. A7-Y]